MRYVSSNEDSVRVSEKAGLDVGEADASHKIEYATLEQTFGRFFFGPSSGLLEERWKTLIVLSG